MTTTALEYAIKLLAKKDYSEFKLRKKLESKLFQTDEIESAFIILRKKRYLRDDVYAEDKAISMLQKDYGDLLIFKKLEVEHLRITQSRLNQLRSEMSLSVEKALESLINKKISQNTDLELPKLKIKINNYLISKGFDFYQIEEVLENYFRDNLNSTI